MTGEIELSSILAGTVYKISSFAQKDSDYSNKLIKMGFTEGCELELATVNLRDPMVFDIRGSRIALRRREAQKIMVKRVA